MIVCAILCTFMYSYENSRCSFISHDFKLHDDKWCLTPFHLLIGNLSFFFEMFIYVCGHFLFRLLVSLQDVWNPLYKDVSLLLAFYPCLWLTYAFSSWWLWTAEYFVFYMVNIFFSFMVMCFLCFVYSKVMKKFSFFFWKHYSLNFYVCDPSQIHSCVWCEARIEDIPSY